MFLRPCSYRRLFACFSDSGSNINTRFFYKTVAHHTFMFFVDDSELLHKKCALRSSSLFLIPMGHQPFRDILDHGGVTA